jgi:predicted aldo/keto reductase-like oxidoreductase
MKVDSRRDFLRKSITGIAGAAIASRGINAAVPEFNNKPVPALPTRLLGKTGINTPLISLGTSGVTATGFVKAAYEAGVKLFFSATYYGEGNNEILVGEALKNYPRDSYIIGTAAVPDGIDMRTGLLPPTFTADSFMKKAESSLKRFGIDHIDIVLLPYAGKKETVLNEAVLKTFEQLKKQGKARFTGIASHGDTVEALNSAAASGVYDMAMIAYNYKAGDIQALNTAISSAVKSGMGIVAMKSTAGGARGKGSAFNSNAVLKWVLQNENISSIVSGMTSLEELQKNLAMITNLKLSEQEKKYLNLAALDQPDGLYCRQCGECIPQCPHKLDIPSIMRSYMYAYGYKNMKHAWYNLKNTGIAENSCSDCTSCNVKCSSGFDVRKKITDIGRLKDIPVEFLA